MGCMKKDPRVTISLDKRERIRLERVAADHQRSVAGEARFAIIKHLDASQTKDEAAA